MSYLRDTWSKAKNAALKQNKVVGSEQIFKQDFGPTLDAFEAAAKKCIEAKAKYIALLREYNELRPAVR